jgi:hypothetical protein
MFYVVPDTLLKVFLKHGAVLTPIGSAYYIMVQNYWLKIA